MKTQHQQMGCFTESTSFLHKLCFKLQTREVLKFMCSSNLIIYDFLNELFGFLSLCFQHQMQLVLIYNWDDRDASIGHSLTHLASGLEESFKSHFYYLFSLKLTTGFSLCSYKWKQTMCWAYLVRWVGPAPRWCCWSCQPCRCRRRHLPPWGWRSGDSLLPAPPHDPRWRHKAAEL